MIRGKHDIIVNALAWSPDSRFLLSGSNDKTARVWDLDGKQVLSLPTSVRRDGRGVEPRRSADRHGEA